MAAGTAVYPGGVNTFVKNHQATGNMIVSYSRNPTDFPLARYVQYVPVKKTSGYYLRLTAENAARIVDMKLSEFVWPDGADRPRRNSGTEKFAFHDYRTERYDFDFTLGYKAEGEADWDIRDTEAAMHAQQAMTGRTVAVQQMLQDTANWDASHVIDVTTIPGNTGSWELSTTARADIKRSINYGREIIHKHTLGVVKKKDLLIVMSPETAKAIGQSQELIDYMKGSPEARNEIKGDRAEKYADFGIPDTLYGVEVVVEDAVVVTSARGAATPVYQYAAAEGIVHLVSRPGGLVSKAATGPSFSTATVFMLEEMTVEDRNDADNRRIEGHVVDDYDPGLTSPVSGFYFQAVTE